VTDLIGMRISRIAAAATSTACLVLAIPSLASAKDYCVGAPAGCTGAAVPSAGLAATLAEAAINGSDDRVFLGAATFDAGALSYNSLDKLELIGAGAGKSVLRSSVAGPVLTLGGNPDSKVAGPPLTISARTPPALAGGLSSGRSRAPRASGRPGGERPRDRASPRGGTLAIR
jgi:hypothetical protein